MMKDGGSQVGKEAWLGLPPPSGGGAHLQKKERWREEGPGRVQEGWAVGAGCAQKPGEARRALLTG